MSEDDTSLINVD